MGDNSNMKTLLGDFLNSRRVQSGTPYNYVSLEPSGKYYIPGDEKQDFFTLYSNYLCTSRKQHKTAHGLTLAQSPACFTPLRIDFDFKYKFTEDPSDARIYEKKTLTDLSKIICAILKRSVQAKEHSVKDIFSCIVLEKKAPRFLGDGVFKDGFHFHYPKMICEEWVFDYINNELKKILDGNGFWEEIEVEKNAEFISSTNLIVDSGIEKKPWLMYGSAKNEASEPYMFSFVLDNNTVETTLEAVFSLEMKNKKNSAHFYLPSLLSIADYDKYIQFDEKIKIEYTTVHKINTIKSKRRNDVPRSRTDEEILQDVKTIEDADIMGMLSLERADDYNLWMDVGWTLFNIGEGAEECLNMWIEFSRQSSKFRPGECEELWNGMRLGGKTIASLFMMAKQDNPKEYEEWRQTNIKFFLYEAIKSPKPNEWDIAQVMMRMYSERFVCSNRKSNIWYEFKNHRYESMDDAQTLYKLIPKEVKNLFVDLMMELMKKKRDFEDKSISAEYNNTEDETSSVDALKINNKIKKISAIINALKDFSFMTKVVKVCKTEMYDKKFTERADENKMLIGCSNGVIDLESKIFREGRPDDYITQTTKIPYIEYSHHDEEIKLFEDCFNKIFPNKNRREYFFDFMCRAMRGGNVNKKFLCQTGEGDNGKSIVTQIIEETFGEYVIKFPRELLIRGNGSSSSSARPELARVRGKRFAILQEIAHTEELDIGRLKELTGNDSFFTRNLHEKGFDLKPMFTMMLQCNKLPKIPGDDQPTWNRVRVLLYESTFNSHAPTSISEQYENKHFVADKEFDSKIPKISSVLLWYLFDRYKNMKSLDLVEPPEVTVATDEYRQECDVYKQFFSERFEKIEDPEYVYTTYVTLKDANVQFKEWYSENYPSYKMSKGINEFAIEMKKKGRAGAIKNPTKKPKEGDMYGYGFKNRFWGYRLSSNEDDDEDQPDPLIAKITQATNK